MLEHDFVKPSTHDRIRGSWLASPIERYVEWLETHGYTRATVVGRVPLLFQFAEFAQKNGCTDIGAARAFVEAFVSEWLSQHGAGVKTSASLRKQKIYAESVVLQMLRLVSEGTVKRNRHCHAFPLKSEAPGFADYLRSERGLNEITIYTFRRHLKEFADYLDQAGVASLRMTVPRRDDSS